jgi:hypothetical protein
MFQSPGPDMHGTGSRCHPEHHLRKQEQILRKISALALLNSLLDSPALKIMKYQPFRHRL